MTCGETLPGTLSVGGESDCFTFTGQVGETVSITTQETAGFFQACWILYTPTGAALGPECAQETRTLPETGTYTIVIYDNPVPFVETGAYDVNLVFVSDTASNCAEPIGCGDTLARPLTLIGESDTFMFAADVVLGQPFGMRQRVVERAIRGELNRPGKRVATLGRRRGRICGARRDAGGRRRIAGEHDPRSGAENGQRDEYGRSNAAPAGRAGRAQHRVRRRNRLRRAGGRPALPHHTQ